MKPLRALPMIVILACAALAKDSSDSDYLQISGVYPHLTTYGYYGGEVPNRDEAGIGAVVPWAGRLWYMNYAAHKPYGSDHKLFSIDESMNLTIHPESVGGTPAGRMIHRESNQLLMGHYIIDASGRVRVIQPQDMPGRITAIARHLEDPANLAYYYDMEGMLYEVNVHTLAFEKLFHKPVPGWHGKGAYTGQGRLVISNNGEHVGGTFRKGISDEEARDILERIRAQGPEERGSLASWDGEEWTVIERRQYVDVTGPGDLCGNASPDDPIWAIGWDRRSLRLKLLDGGAWSTFLLPKASYANDAIHGWYTEWPRIRKVGKHGWMMDMHGMFFAFPETFKRSNTAGIAPIGSHLRYIPDFTEWHGKVVLATNETSMQGNPLAGQSQSNLWFGDFSELREWGPGTGYGGPWSRDQVAANRPSDPFLVNGFSQGCLHLELHQAGKAGVTIEIDRQGNGDWETLREVEVEGYLPLPFPEGFEAQWARLSVNRDCLITAHFHLTDRNFRDGSRHEALFKGLADASEKGVQGYALYPRAENRNLAVWDLGHAVNDFTKGDFRFEDGRPLPDTVKDHLALHAEIRVDEASVIIESRGERLRLPKGAEEFDQPFAFGWPRVHREVESERELANLHGTFYELPLETNDAPPVFRKMRPVSSHRKQISDFCSWNGLLVLAGVSPNAEPSVHVYRNDADGGGLWLGAIDDLWKLGKPVGQGGPWKDTQVRANQPSDPYLMTGYDQKRMTLRADRETTVIVEIDYDHNGWTPYKRFSLRPNEPIEHAFPPAFSAHWIRLRAEDDCIATAWLEYE